MKSWPVYLTILLALSGVIHGAMPAHALATYEATVFTSITIAPQNGFGITLLPPPQDQPTPIQEANPPGSAAASATAILNPGTAVYTINDTVAGSANSPPSSSSFAFAGSAPGSIIVTNMNAVGATFVFAVVNFGHVAVSASKQDETARAFIASQVRFDGNIDLFGVPIPTILDISTVSDGLSLSSPGSQARDPSDSQTAILSLAPGNHRIFFSINFANGSATSDVPEASTLSLLCSFLVILCFLRGWHSARMKAL